MKPKKKRVISQTKFQLPTSALLPGPSVVVDCGHFLEEKILFNWSALSSWQNGLNQLGRLSLQKINNILGLLCSEFVVSNPELLKSSQKR